MSNSKKRVIESGSLKKSYLQARILSRLLMIVLWKKKMSRMNSTKTLWRECRKNLFKSRIWKRMSWSKSKLKWKKLLKPNLAVRTQIWSIFNSKFCNKNQRLMTKTNASTNFQRKWKSMKFKKRYRCSLWKMTVITFFRLSSKSIMKRGRLTVSKHWKFLNKNALSRARKMFRILCGRKGRWSKRDTNWKKKLGRWSPKRMKISD